MKTIVEIKKIVDCIPGFILNDEGKLLYDLAKKCPNECVIVEIGSWKGRSTIWLAFGSLSSNKAKVYAIDPHTGSPEHKKIHREVWTFEEFKQNIKKAGLQDCVIPVLKTSAEAAIDFNKKIGLIFIDGNHAYKMVKKDYQLWFPKLIDGGIIAFHDTTVYQGVEKLVRKFIFKSFSICNVGFVGSIVYGQKVKRNTFIDRVRNRYILFLHDIYVLAAKLNPPSCFVKIGKKMSQMAQMKIKNAQ